MYERLLEEAREQGITVLERYPFVSPRIRGLCCDSTIAISSQIETEAERTVVLCEELTHATHSAGNILNDARMERRTRERIFDRLIGTAGLVNAYLDGCREAWEFADWFGVPQAFLTAAVENYGERYGTAVKVNTDKGCFVLRFLPTLCVRPLPLKHSHERLRTTTARR